MTSGLTDPTLKKANNIAYNARPDRDMINFMVSNENTDLTCATINSMKSSCVWLSCLFFLPDMKSVILLLFFFSNYSLLLLYTTDPSVDDVHLILSFKVHFRAMYDQRN